MKNIEFAPRLEMMVDGETDPKVLKEIWKLKEQLKDRVLFLGHHYQRDEVIQFADKTGDSFELAKFAAQNRDKEFIVFCGVHFMAETADILTSDEQKVILPDLKAGCSMADMALYEDVLLAWKELKDATNQKIIPITYMNSSAAIKAFVGQNDGLVCTSSNADKALKWALEKGDKILFIPDQHLGRNTAYEMGIPLNEMIVWNPYEVYGGNSKEQIQKAKMILWLGHCSVHQQFQPQHVDYYRNLDPEIKIIVHPECKFEVVQKADYSGSTSKIIKMIAASPAGSKWAVGTENHLVKRLAHTFTDKEIHLLSPYVCQCSTMFRIDPVELLEVLKSIHRGEIINQIIVDKEIQHWAKVALDRMLNL
jgi:quinolinate synthase